MEKYSPNKQSRVMSRDEVRAFDAWAIDELGIPGVVLMENAGRSCAELIKEELAGLAEPQVCIFCGTGNNGGDGYVVARHLLNAGFKIRVAICGDRSKIRGDAKINLDILDGMGQPIEQIDINGRDIDSVVKGFAADADMVVDAIFGTGLKGSLSEQYIQLIETLNVSNCPILAVDIPSGLDCDTGRPLGAAVKAGCTVTFAVVKRGFAVAAQAEQYTGQIYVASIGVEPTV